MCRADCLFTRAAYKYTPAAYQVQADNPPSKKPCTKTLFLLPLLSKQNSMTTTIRSEYIAPAVRVIPVHTENAICDSVIPGGNEDVGYDDWD